MNIGSNKFGVNLNRVCLLEKTEYDLKAYCYLIEGQHGIIGVCRIYMVDNACEMVKTGGNEF